MPEMIMSGDIGFEELSPQLQDLILQGGDGSGGNGGNVSLKSEVKSVHATTDRQKEFTIPMSGYIKDVHLFELRLGSVWIYPERYTIIGNKVILNEDEAGIALGRRLDFVFCYLVNGGSGGVGGGSGELTEVDGAIIISGTITKEKLETVIQTQLNAIDGKAEKVHTHDDLEAKINGKADAVHDHNEFEALQTAIDGKSDIHEHPYSALDHKHTKNEIEDFPTSLPANGGNADTVDNRHFLWENPTDVSPTFLWGNANDNTNQKLFKPSQLSVGNADTVGGKNADYFMPKSGGTFTENVSFNKYLMLNAWEGYGTGQAGLWYDGTNKCVEVSNATGMKINGQTVYHTANKPKKADVGLGNIQNWGASSSISANSTTEYATTNMVAQVRAEKSNATNLVNGTVKGSLKMDSASVASGELSFAEGMCTNATGSGSHAEGYMSTASDSYAHAQGFLTTASAPYSHAEGAQTRAENQASHAEGWNTVATGWCSHIEGEETTAETYLIHVQGRYNKVNSGTKDSYSSTNNAFVIGNGDDGALSNAFRITYNGKTYGLSAFNSSGADYAEYFEWEDGNPENEDRIGYFVTLDGNKIRLANSNDDYIIGIISGNQSIIGNACEDGWNDMYLRDEFDRLQYEDVEVEREEFVLNNETNELETKVKKVIEKHIKLNPAYNPNMEYIPRSERKEWGVVGMMGQIKVRDDGTCQVNGYCRPSENGVATHTDDTSYYRVIERINDNLIRVVMK